MDSSSVAGSGGSPVPDSTRVTVAVRIRPQRTDTAVERYDTVCLYSTPPQESGPPPSSSSAASSVWSAAPDVPPPTLVTIIHPSTKEQTDFAFDRVFDENDTQSTVYSELVEDPLMQAVESRSDLTVVAYGQTGSGKTFTMLGERPSPATSRSTPSSPTLSRDWLSPESGLFLRTLNSLLAFREVSKDTMHILIYLTAIEIYNDTFIDLLASTSSQASSPNRVGPGRTRSSLGGSAVGGVSVQPLHSVGSGMTTSLHHAFAATTALQSPLSLSGLGALSGASPAGSSSIEVRELGENLIVTGVQRVLLDSLDDIQRCFDVTHKNRSVSATAMNDVSSRSHALFQIDVVMQQRQGGGDGGNRSRPDFEAVLDHQLLTCLNTGGSSTSSALAPPASSLSSTSTAAPPQPFNRSESTGGGGGFGGTNGGGSHAPALLQLRHAMGHWASRNQSNDFEKYPLESCRITLVDLAGSERVKRSGVVGREMQEAVFVNSSLSTLGLVVHCLCTRNQSSASVGSSMPHHGANHPPKTHIPFRDSKMTRLLRPSFISPKSRIIFVTNLAPTSQSYVETLNSMRFAGRLKELKVSLPGGSSGSSGGGPSLGTLLSDERLQRMRLQIDEMCADMRVLAATVPSWSGNHAIVPYPASPAVLTNQRGPQSTRLMTRARRTLVERPNATANDVVRELLCCPNVMKEATQRAREDAHTAQSKEEAERRAHEESVKHAAVLEFRSNVRLSQQEHEAHVTKLHLEESIKQMDRVLQLTIATCSADMSQWKLLVDEEIKVDEERRKAIDSLSARRREVSHALVALRTADEELAEEEAMLRQSTQMNGALTVRERSSLMELMSASRIEAEASAAIVNFQKTLCDRLRGACELTYVRNILRRADERASFASEGEFQALVLHELDPSFTTRLSAAPLSSIFDATVVRTPQGRNRIVNERLESAASIFTVSPLAYYFSPELTVSTAPRYVRWEMEDGSMSQQRAASASHPDGSRGLLLGCDAAWSDEEDIEGDGLEDGGARLRAASMNRIKNRTSSTSPTRAFSEQRRSMPRHADPEAGAPHATSSGPTISRRAVRYYLRFLSLYGHLMRILIRAEHRRRDSAVATAPLFTATEIRAILVVLDAVEVEGHVAESVVRRALAQVAAPTDASASETAMSPKSRRHPTTVQPTLDTPPSRNAPVDGEVMPHSISSKTTAILSELVAMVKCEQSTAGVNAVSDAMSSWYFTPCLIRCLQILSLTWMTDSFFTPDGCHTTVGSDQSTPTESNGGVGRHLHALLHRDVALELSRLMAHADTISEEDSAILKGCKWACRAAGGSLDSWGSESPHSSTTTTAASGSGGHKKQQQGFPLWQHKAHDLSLLRSLATRCLVHGGLLRKVGLVGAADLVDCSGVAPENAPTPAKFLECVHLVFRGM